MSDENTNSNPELDPLSGAASGVEEPRFPILQGGRIYRFKVIKSEVVPTKADPNRETLCLCLATTKPYTDTEGHPYQEGMKSFHYVAVTTTEGTNDKRPLSITDIKKSLCQILRAVGLKDTSARELLSNPSILEGHIIDMSTSVRPAKGGYPESNGFKPVEPA